MPRAHGRDRLEALPEGRVAVVCREAKGWQARQKAPAHHHRADHPGTAVLWGDAHWEVLEMERRPDGSVRYVLVPWDETQVFRGLVRYDDESEALREEIRRAELRAESHRSVLILLSPLAGLLPEEDQLRLELRLGVPASRMTLISAVLGLMFGTYCVVMLVASGLGGGAVGLPMAILVLGDLLFMESFARLVVVLSQGRPIGSFLTLPWLVFRAVREPPAPDLSHPPDARDLEWERHRTFHALQPVLALLPEEDQRRLQDSYAFDYVGWGRTTAFVLGGIGLLFAGSALLNLLAGVGGPGELLWLGAGLALCLEQRSRLAKLREGRAAGSFLGRLVRRPARSILEPLAPQPAAG